MMPLCERSIRSSTHTIVESEQDDQDDLELQRQHEELRQKRIQYEEREHEREKITHRLIRSFGIDPNSAPEPIRLRGELGSVDEELFIPPLAGDVDADHVESMAMADAPFAEFATCAVRRNVCSLVIEARQSTHTSYAYAHRFAWRTRAYPRWRYSDVPIRSATPGTTARWPALFLSLSLSLAICLFLVEMMMIA